MREDVFVRLISLPPAIKGLTVPNADGTYSVYINNCLSVEMQRHALNHELYHIDHDHLYSNAPVAIAERAAGGTVIEVLFTPAPTKAPAPTVMSKVLTYMTEEEYQRFKVQRCEAWQRRFEQGMLSGGYTQNRCRKICIDVWK